MREIKFRAWDTENKCWYNPIYKAYKGELYYLLMNIDNGNLLIQDMKSLHGKFKFDRFILMQYTGLKDKNGKEIYEGDILTEDNEFIDGIVQYMNDRGAYYLVDNEGYATDSDCAYDGMEWNKLTIIGNEWENPELLEEK